MIISDRGIIIKIRPFQEQDAIVSCLSEKHGIMCGMVKKYKTSKRMRAIVEIGHLVDIEKYAKEDSLGRLSLDSVFPFSYLNIHDMFKLNLITCMCELVCQFLQDNNDGIFGGSVFKCFHESLLSVHQLADRNQQKKIFLLFCKNLINMSGYGLCVDKCYSGSGEQSELIYISPNSLNAISAKAGHPYKEKMLTMPKFFLESKIGYSCENERLEDIHNGVKVIHFALKKVFFENMNYPLGVKVSRTVSAWVDNK